MSDLESLEQSATAAIAAICEAISVRPDRSAFLHGTALFDSRRDEHITGHPSFPRLKGALAADPRVAHAFGDSSLERLAMQCVYKSVDLLDGTSSCSGAAGDTWSALQRELASPCWRFAAVANMSNFSYDGECADLGNGVTIRGRSFDWLRTELGFKDIDLKRLTEDWTAGGSPSSYVLVIATSQPKSPENFILHSDGEAHALGARALLAMRLVGSGDVHVGRMSHHRPAVFDVGLGGRSYSGWTAFRPGQPYLLTDSMVPAIQRQVTLLATVERDLQTRARQVGLALRSFSSLYDRLLGQQEDRIIDSITALEALWKLDGELSFKLAFRTAALLGLSDDDRERTFQTLRKYYSIRSKIVHGVGLKAEDQELVHNDESLREIVRRVLRGFLYLLAHPGEWTVSKVMSDPDLILLHSERRASLQKAMALDDAGTT